MTCLFDGLTSLTLDGLHINLIESLHKELTVFRIHNSLHRSTQYLDIVFLQYTTLIEFNTTIQCSLSAKGQQDTVRTFFLYDTFYKKRLDWQEIDLVGNTLRSLHGSDIRIDEHRLHTLLTQRLQCL